MPKIHQWKKMKEKNRFYINNIMTEYISLFCEEYKPKKTYTVLISLVGFSPATSILTCSAIKPKKLYLYGTFKSIKESSSLITDFIKKSDDNVRIFEIEIDEHDIHDMYKRLYSLLSEEGKENCIIDLTGGKKSMSAVAGIISSIFNIDSCYVDYWKYLNDLRAPYFSSEYLKILDNPFYLSGDKLIMDAINYFNSGNFKSSARTLSEYTKSKIISKQHNARILEEISLGYKAWMGFDFENAQEHFMKVLKSPANVELKNILEEHCALLTKINQNDTYGIFNHLVLGNYYAKLERFEIAVFLYYRTIEMILQKVLRDHYSFETSKPDFSKIGIEFKDFKKKAEEVYEEEYLGTGLPNRTALMDNVFILSIKQNEIMKKINIKKLFNASKIRNRSNMAHGSAVITEKNLNETASITNQMINNFIKAYKIEENIKSIEAKFEIPKIEEKHLL